MPRGLELLIAQTILQGFRRSVMSIPRSDFQGAAAFRANRLACCPAGDENRIHLYDHHVGLVVEQLRCITNGQSTDAAYLPAR